MAYKVLFNIEKKDYSLQLEDKILDNNFEYVVTNDEKYIFQYEEIDTKKCIEDSEMDEDFESEIVELTENNLKIWISSYELDDGINKAILINSEENFKL